jgi:hypothetical protein
VEERLAAADRAHLRRAEFTHEGPWRVRFIRSLRPRACGEKPHDVGSGQIMRLRQLDVVCPPPYRAA